MTRVSSLVGLAVAATLLTGCGAVPDLNPGTAVRVDDTTYSLDEVADLAGDYCDAVRTQLQEGEMVANAVINSQVAGSLALRAAAEQFAGEEGVSPDATYEQAQQQLDASIAELTADQQEAVRDVNLARPYAEAVQVAVGKQGGAGDDEALGAGQQTFADWLSDQDVRIDPRFSVSVADGAIASSDTSVSYSVSSTARSGASAEPDPTYAAGLPQTQRCG
ncbi:hypothetical protein [Nocardioides sp. YIM 152315]|uniref:hypothetical protein n=1 Tax=Nocardioides sp. YIM 152315 TaxID=3031760 RepID=UPI0023DBCF64|nr:hypothetical protein [Nocardioides sp. YIM 152315]MDF1603431.1 hypothetical protein [Nocardioides sp. YIM 152315]